MDIINIKNVADYNQLFGLENHHPLVSVVNLKDATKFPNHFTVNYGVYALFLKNTRCGDIRYGKQTYDYQEGTVTSFAPGQIVEVQMPVNMRPEALGLLFHPDLIKGTSLGQEIKAYSFFSYQSNEALHLSGNEKKIFIDCLEKIKMELTLPGDHMSKRLIARNIQLLLDYCMRFYERQFETRSPVNKNVLIRFEELLDDYFSNKNPEKLGLPTVKYFADKVYLSANYFGDLIKKETGKTAQEYIQNKLIEHAKELIIDTNKTITQIAYELGFQYSQHFNRVFKKSVGSTPVEYRRKQTTGQYHF